MNAAYSSTRPALSGPEIRSDTASPAADVERKNSGYSSFVTQNGMEAFVMKIRTWLALALVLAGRAGFAQEPIIPPLNSTSGIPILDAHPVAPPAPHVAPAPVAGHPVAAPGCASCGEGHAEGDIKQRIIDWVLYRPELTPCCGCGCGGCKECYCKVPNLWEFFPCCGPGVLRKQCDYDDCGCGGCGGGCGVGCIGNKILSMFHRDP
jgi:hypothetical protein